MSSNSYTTTFNETHAKKLASKVATDLKRMQRFYGDPSDSRIEDYEKEIIEFLKKGYLDTVTYGYQRAGKWIEPTLRYTSKDLSSMLNATDDDPGRIPAGADINGATFRSFMSYTWDYHLLSAEEKEKFESNLPFSRSSAVEPGLDGYMTNDKTYSAGGKSLDRSTLKKY